MFSRYRRITGCRYALITTVDVRSYSRNSGRIWCEIDNGTPSASNDSATASSFFALANENNSEIATDSGFAEAT